MTARARLAAVLCVAVVLGACGGGAGTGPSTSEDAARLASASVGSDVVLGPGDVTAINVIGLDLQGLAAPLRTWWDTLNDPSVTAAAWTAQAARLLDDMRAVVAHIEAQLGPGRDRTVRDAYAPYLAQWRRILDALGAVRDGVVSGDEAVQAEATATYNDAVRALARLDRARIDRLVAVYGRDETRRFLAAQGIDPSPYGL